MNKLFSNNKLILNSSIQIRDIIGLYLIVRNIKVQFFIVIF
jgi:hypothetical protein